MKAFRRGHRLDHARRDPRRRQGDTRGQPRRLPHSGRGRPGRCAARQRRMDRRPVDCGRGLRGDRRRACAVDPLPRRSRAGAGAGSVRRAAARATERGRFGGDPCRPRGGPRDGRRRPSSWPPRQPRNIGHGVAHPTGAGAHCSSARIRQVGADAALEGVQPLVRFRYTFRLACRTRAVWQCRPVPSSSGLLPPAPCASRARLPPASATRCDGAVGSLTPLGHSQPDLPSAWLRW
jgi:hypothetical protein